MQFYVTNFQISRICRQINKNQKGKKVEKQLMWPVTTKERKKREKSLNVTWPQLSIGCS